MITAAIAIFIIVLTWDIISDYRKWLKKKTVKHRLEWLIRIALLLPAAAGLANMLKETQFFWAVCWSYLLIGSVWWLLFDGIYNTLRGFGWWFNGSAELNKDRSWLDGFLTKLSNWLEAVIKFSLIAGSLVLYIKLLP